MRPTACDNLLRFNSKTFRFMRQTINVFKINLLVVQQPHPKFPWVFFCPTRVNAATAFDREGSVRNICRQSYLGVIRFSFAYQVAESALKAIAHSCASAAPAGFKNPQIVWKEQADVVLEV
eukprot:GHVT01020553.1.p1 GENE.GHVT01020553.1~~GHVT01020553.1.p1  ORF type:complete len:121 (+),score=5.94 GHVT01020553.1:2879-3241(+)